VYQRVSDANHENESLKGAYEICNIGHHRDECVNEALDWRNMKLGESWDDVAFVSLAPIPIGWMIGYLAFFVTRWIGAGFNR
jgi:hypothetical protein